MQSDATQPAATPVMVKPGQEKFKAACEKSMREFAAKAGVDPDRYIAQNQLYLRQCIDYYDHPPRK